MQTDLERSGKLARLEIRVHAIGIAALFAHFIDQAGNETATAERVVAHQQREIVRIAAADGRHADEDMALRRRMRDTNGRRLGQGHCGDRRLDNSSGQVSREELGDALGFGATDVADDGNHGTTGGVMVVVEGDQIIAAQTANAGGHCRDPIGMIGIDRRGETPAGNAVWPCIGFLNRRHGARPLSRHDCLGKARSGQRQAHQIERSIPFGLVR